MTIDPSRVVFFKPAKMSAPKDKLFESMASHLGRYGGTTVRGNIADLEKQANDGRTPIIGCSPEIRHLIDRWLEAKKTFVYWDRGYFRRIYACADFNKAQSGTGFYRWHLNSFQAQSVRDVPDDRWKALRIPVADWQRGGRHIVIAAPTRTYTRFHGIGSWIADTIDALARVTDRQLVIRDKEHVRNRPIQLDLKGAHCLVSHGSVAAIEAVLLGCPVFVDPCSAAALVGRTNIKDVERPVYPERQRWLASLSYSQFDEAELVNGVLWSLLQ